MEYGYDTYTSEIPDDILEILLELCKEAGVDPLSSMESEAYFCELIKKYSGNKSEIRQYFEKMIKREFKFMKERPVWIQGKEWQFYNGKPMIFAGQIDTFVNKNGFSYGISFYVFWDSKYGVTKTVTQSD